MPNDRFKDELQELDAEFANSATMTLETYFTRQKDIRARQNAYVEAEKKRAAQPSRRVNFERLAQVNALCDPNDLRVIEGIASSRHAMNNGCALDPLGASWELPLPLCFDHDTHKRIGWVVDAQAGPTRITFTAKLAKSGLYQNTEDAWRSIVSGSLPCVSVGSVSGSDVRSRVDVDRVFHRWVWSELTVCRSGRNPDAKILVVKSTRYGKEILMRDVRPAPRVVRLCA